MSSETDFEWNEPGGEGNSGASSAQRINTAVMPLVFLAGFAGSVMFAPHDGPAWLLGMRPLWPLGFALGVVSLFVAVRLPRLPKGRATLLAILGGPALTQIADRVFGLDGRAFLTGVIAAWFMGLVYLFVSSSRKRPDGLKNA